MQFLTRRPGVNINPTMNPTTFTSHLTPYTLHSTHYPPHPTPYTLHPTPHTGCGHADRARGLVKTQVSRVTSWKPGSWAYGIAYGRPWDP